jgi:hypothetical protein
MGWSAEGTGIICCTRTSRQRRWQLARDAFLGAVYVLMDAWWQAPGAAAPRGPGRPAPLRRSEVLTLAVVAQWPCWRSARDFWRFARGHLRASFPTLGRQSQCNRRGRGGAGRAGPARRPGRTARQSRQRRPRAGHHAASGDRAGWACRHGLCAPRRPTAPPRETGACRSRLRRAAPPPSPAPLPGWCPAGRSRPQKGPGAVRSPRLPPHSSHRGSRCVPTDGPS